MEARTEGRILGVATMSLVLIVDVSLITYARSVFAAKNGGVLPSSFPLVVLVLIGPTLPGLWWGWRRFQQAG